MNEDTVSGTINDVKGQVKEKLDSATGDTSLQAGGIVDQVKGVIQKTLGGIAGDNTPGNSASATASATVEKAKKFAKDRPWATAALVGVVGMAVLNTLRGRR